MQTKCEIRICASTNGVHDVPAVRSELERMVGKLASLGYAVRSATLSSNMHDQLVRQEDDDDEDDDDECKKQEG